MSKLQGFLNRLFAREEMDGDGLCPTYLVRWTILKLWGGRGVYLHHFVGDDWSSALHDHPKRFISVGLRGRYRETTPTGERIYIAPWVRTFPATHTHRITLIDGRDCWTIVVVLKTSREWGFWSRGQWVPWRRYVDSADAVNERSCP
jgi:hypothetical protein